MKTAFIFPGQGCQKEGMGKDLYDKSPIARELFERGNELLGRRITDVMFDGTEIDLMQTINTQPAVFLYEVAAALSQNDVCPNIVAGHSLGEFASLVVAGALSLEDGLRIVFNRAVFGQEACDKTPTAMGAVIGLSEDYVEKRLKEIWQETGEPIYIANYNGPGQIVYTGAKVSVKMARKVFMEEGAKKAVTLPISGSFHSPYMDEAQAQLAEIINSAHWNNAQIPVYQCVDAKPHTNADELRNNLIVHITHPVLWTDMTHNMVADGATDFYEVGTDDTLQKIVARMYPSLNVQSIWNIESYKNVKPYKIIEEL